MHKIFHAVLLFFLLLFGCQQQPKDSLDQVKNLTILEYLDSLPASANPQLFLPELLSTENHEHSGIISHDLQHFYYTVSDTNFANFHIKEIKFENGHWSKPKTASFSGQYTDHAVSFSPDGKTLLLSSTRPKINLIDWDIWFAKKSSSGWQAPQKLDSIINTSMLESHASMSNEGKIYFHANYEQGGFVCDIYYSNVENGQYTKPIKLDDAINTEKIEVTPYVSPDEQYLIFAGYDYPSGFGAGDLYISFKGPDGKWLQAINMGSTVNTEHEESNPHVSPDGKYLFFSSTRKPNLKRTTVGGGMDIYWISAEIINQLKSKSQ